MKYILKTEVNGNGNKVFSKQRNGKIFLYAAQDENGNFAPVDKEWILRNKANIVNLGISGTNIYPTEVKKTNHTVLTFTQITDDRWEKDIENKLLDIVDRIKRNLNRYDFIKAKTNNFREVRFGDSKQYRCDFYVIKTTNKVTWNDIYGVINGIKAVPYTLTSGLDFNSIEDKNYKPADCGIKALYENVRDWYMEAYPTDELGEEINECLTFKDVAVSLNEGKDIYHDVIEVGDSLVRERIFSSLADRLKVDYDVIWNKCLYGSGSPDIEIYKRIYSKELADIKGFSDEVLSEDY